MRKCIVCKKPKSDAEFYTKKKFAGSKDYLSSFCKNCDIKRIRLSLKSLRIRMVEYKGSRCIKCGYHKCINALEFHHRDRKQKEYRLSSARSFSLRVKTELDKCDLLCANCHREVEFEYFLSRGVE